VVIAGFGGIWSPNLRSATSAPFALLVPAGLATHVRMGVELLRDIQQSSRTPPGPVSRSQILDRRPSRRCDHRVPIHQGGDSATAPNARRPSTLVGLLDPMQNDTVAIGHPNEPPTWRRCLAQLAGPRRRGFQRVAGLVGRRHAEPVLVETEDFDIRRKALGDALRVLSGRERRIFEARRLTDEPITLEALAEEFGVSRERVRQIEVCAFEKLRNAVRRQVAAMEPLEAPGAHWEPIPVSANAVGT
jgi:RNA polymerase sigma factor (sigma-70 family)